MKRIFTVLITAILLLSCAVTVFASDEVPKCIECGSENIENTEYEYDSCKGGHKTVHCKDCDKTYTQELTPNHNYEFVELTATCTEDGDAIYVCSKCGDKKIQIAPAFGHAFVYVDTVSPDENTDGYFELRCERCGLETQERIPRIIHAESNRKSSGTAFPIIIIAAIAAAAGAFIVLKKKLFGNSNNAAKQRETNNTDTKKPDLDLSRKSVMWPEYKDESMDEFRKYLMNNRLVELQTVDMEQDGAEDIFLHDIKEKEPDMVLLAMKENETADSIREITEHITGECGDVTFGIIAPKDASEDLLSGLEGLCEDKKITSFCRVDESDYKTFTALFLPLYKPEISLDKGIETIGKIADQFGIPMISSAIDLYSNAKDLKDLSQKDKNLKNTTDIVAIIADIMGWEKVTSVTDFLSSAEKAATLVNEENERQAVLNDIKQ